MDPFRGRSDGKARGRILVAEDNPANQANQKVIQHTLEGLGYRSDLASNGREAVQMWSSFSYQSILMDYAMPEMDGFEATAEIRRQEQEKQTDRRIPIIALTANAMEMEEDKERCLKAGMDDYLSKPFKWEDLEAILERWQQAAPSDESEIKTDASGATQPTPSSHGPVDTDTIKELSETMGQEFGRYIDLFLQKTGEHMESIRAAAAQGNTKALGETAGSLKSASGFIGAARISKICEQLQRFAHMGDIQDADILIKKLKDEFPSIGTWLEEA